MKPNILIVLVLITSIASIASILPVQPQEIQGKILVDVGHSSLDVERILGDLMDYLETNNYYIEYTRTILYLDPYDVLIIAIPTQPFTEEELNSIRQFVNGGGGLLLFGESGVLSTENVEDFNVLAGSYGFEFQRDVVMDPVNNLTLDKPYSEIPIIVGFANHPVTRNVERIFLVSGCSLRLSQRAKKLAWGGEETYGDRLSEIYGYGGGSYEPDLEKRGEELVVIASSESGEGRIVALGDTSLFRGKSAAGDPWPRDPLEYLDHKRLALNIFGWLSQKTEMGRAEELVDEAEDLVNQGRYQEARDMLENVRLVSPRTDPSLIRRVAELMIKANQGIEADELFEEGKGFLEVLNCEEASKSLEKAFTIYEGIGDAEKIGACVELLTVCGDLEALLQKGDLLFAEGEALFEEGEYSEALEKIEEAKIIYEGLGNSGKVDECDSFIEKIQNYQRGESEEEILRRNRIVLAVIMLVTAAIIVVLYLWWRSKPIYEEMRTRPPHH